jgi:acyl-coenzyme A synthetase/AMP-(fatty) acid ligase
VPDAARRRQCGTYRHSLRFIVVPFKIPRRIYLVTALPKGDTGKVLRRKLTASLGKAPAEHRRPPRGALRIPAKVIGQSSRR